VAEDNVTNQMVIKRLLALLKINCFIVANGQEAIDALRREKFDLVLMDCQMPVMDGFEATAIIRKDPTLTVVKGTENRLPIIALTANVVKEDQERCFAVGMDDYGNFSSNFMFSFFLVSKPIRKSVLAEALMNNLYRTNLFYAQIKDFIIECRDFDMPRLKKIDIGLSAIKTLLSSLKDSLLKGRNSTLARKGILQQFKSIGK
jgi:CheY-like chemotaxis protein